MRQSVRNWKLGFGLALVTAVLWGILPIGLKVALTELDAWTLTWCRFAGSLLILGIWLGRRGELPVDLLRDRRIWRWLLPGCLGLTGNYVLYVLGLQYTSPAVTQTVIQIAPLLLLVFGMFIFHERFSRLQWLGFGALVFGLAVFFNRRLPELLNPAEGWSFGILLLFVSAISWAIYGVSQKQLLRHLSSAQILFLMLRGRHASSSAVCASRRSSRAASTGILCRAVRRGKHRRGLWRLWVGAGGLGRIAGEFGGGGGPAVYAGRLEARRASGIHMGDAGIAKFIERCGSTVRGCGKHDQRAGKPTSRGVGPYSIVLTSAAPPS